MQPQPGEEAEQEPVQEQDAAERQGQPEDGRLVKRLLLELRVLLLAHEPRRDYPPGLHRDSGGGKDADGVPHGAGVVIVRAEDSAGPGVHPGARAAHVCDAHVHRGSALFGFCFTLLVAAGPRVAVHDAVDGLDRRHALLELA